MGHSDPITGPAFPAFEGVPSYSWATDNGRRTEQAKAHLDPRVDARVRPRERPRERPRQDPRGLISLFSPFQGLPRKLPRNVPRRRPRKCPRKCPVKWSRFTCSVFTCSVHRRQIRQAQKQPQERGAEWAALRSRGLASVAFPPPFAVPLTPKILQF